MRSLNASISASSNSSARCRYLPSRAGVGVMAAVSGGSTLAQEGKDMITAELTDPKSKRPPFKRQSQPWPGLASKMEPQPDHGESSYRGSGRLAGRKALITGGDSGMGRAAAIAYAGEGGAGAL